MGSRKKARRNPADVDDAYSRWINLLPCLICTDQGLRQESRTDGHHYGPRAYGTKVPDKQRLPLCHVAHHEFGRESIHGAWGKHFAERHGLDMWAAIASLNEQYDAGIAASIDVIMKALKAAKKQGKRQQAHPAPAKKQTMSEILRQLREAKAKGR